MLLYTYVGVGVGPSVVMIGFSPSFLRFLFIDDTALAAAAAAAFVVGPALGPFPLAPAIIGGTAAAVDEGDCGCCCCCWDLDCGCDCVW